MAERMDEEMYDDLAYDEAEGPAQAFEEEEFDEADAGDEFDLGDEDEWDAGEDEGDYAEDYGEDAYEEGEEDYGEEGVDEADFEEAMAYALGAEDTDEFFRRAFGALRRVARGAGRVFRRVAPIVGRVARIAAPIARLIPHPWAQAAGPVLNLLGRLRAEGASEEEAMDAFAELATYDESAIPVVAGLAARSILRGRGAAVPLAARRRLVRSMGAAARTLARRRPGGVRALPRIVRSIRRTGAVRRTPLRVAPRIVARTAARVARSPRLMRRLARPTPAARRRARAAVRAGGGGGVPRSFTVRGPVRISITSAA
jgi:hypothetical protein